jgi:hypothetical protein
MCIVSTCTSYWLLHKVAEYRRQLGEELETLYKHLFATNSDLQTLSNTVKAVVLKLEGKNNKESKRPALFNLKELEESATEKEGKVIPFKKDI